MQKNEGMERYVRSWRTSRREWAEAGVRVALSTVVVSASLLKVSDPIPFFTFLTVLGVSPQSVLLVSWTITSIELGLGLLLLLDFGRPWVAFCTSAMMTVFTAVLIFAWTTGTNLDCGCFGTALPSISNRWSILRNAVLCAAGLWLVWSTRPRTHA